jgi:hypothetical protein
MRLLLRKYNHVARINVAYIQPEWRLVIFLANILPFTTIGALFAFYII